MRVRHLLGGAALAAAATFALVAGPASASPAPLTYNTNYSGNWSGYNLGSISDNADGLYNQISGGWTVPTPSYHPVAGVTAEDSADWIGIGGGCSSNGIIIGGIGLSGSCTTQDETLIQTGTSSNVSSSGVAAYDAWWEIIPGPEEVFPIAIHAGDQVFASIAPASAASDGYWTITLQDLTTRRTITQTIPYTSTETSAEWILETPLSVGTGAGITVLPNLTTGSVPGTTFTSPVANGRPVHLGPDQAMVLQGTSGSTATPSAQGPSGDFNVCAWAYSCAGPVS
ncbi:MAG: G1 family glutamic endopeptidase [Candidatus Dormibacteria bacterium]